MPAKAHILKTDADCLELIRVECKTFELRKDDRSYEVGDFLILRETRYTGAQMKLEGKPLEYVGQPQVLLVTHLIRIEARFGQTLGPGVVMSFQMLRPDEAGITECSTAVWFIETHSDGSSTRHGVMLDGSKSTLPLS